MSNDADLDASILVVEDDRLLRSLAVDMLHDDGYAASGVESAAEALTFLQTAGAVDLLVTDINMPGMSGLELIELASLRRPTLNYLIISGREQIAASQLPKRASFLQKPFSAQAFLARVRWLIDPQAERP